MTTEQRFDVTEQLDAHRAIPDDWPRRGVGSAPRWCSAFRGGLPHRCRRSLGRGDEFWSVCHRWFAPVEGDLRLGGRYQVEGNAGGTIERCEAPHLFEATWEFGGGVSWVLVTIAGEGADAARLTLEHRGEVPDEFWTQFGPGATGVGWDLGFFGLAAYLETRTELPMEQTDWMRSPPSVCEAFIAGSRTRAGPSCPHRRTGVAKRLERCWRSCLPTCGNDWPVLPAAEPPSVRPDSCRAAGPPACRLSAGVGGGQQPVR